MENTKKKVARRPVESKAVPGAFASGVCFYKLVWVFVIGCFIGYVVEMLWCMATRGVIESRQGMLYGPFNQIYGFGAVLMVLILRPLAEKGAGWLFLGGMLLGGVYETVCSLLQENIFGTISWDYSGWPLSIGGRINLLYMAFWGILTVAYMKWIYPLMARLIEKMPRRIGPALSWVAVVFFSLNLLLSAGAVSRWQERQNGVAAQNVVHEFLDRQYPNERMELIYPNMGRA